MNGFIRRQESARALFVFFLISAFHFSAKTDTKKSRKGSIKSRTEIGYQVADRYGQRRANPNYRRSVASENTVNPQAGDQMSDMMLPLLLGAAVMGMNGGGGDFDGSVGGSGFAPNVGMNDSGTCSVDLKACASAAGNANPSGGIGVVVDMEQRCLCLGADNCFKVGIGNSGPKMTASGSGKLKGCNQHGSGIYQDKNPPTTAYDNDCFATGIPANDKVGKWLHKPRGCGSVRSGPQITKGCVAVPCSKWLDLEDFVKNQNSNISICNGAGGGSVRRPAAESTGGHRAR